MSKAKIVSVFTDAENSGFFNGVEFDIDSAKTKEDDGCYALTMQVKIKEVDTIEEAKSKILEAFSDASEGGAFDDIGYDSRLIVIKRLDDELFEMKAMVTIENEDEDEDIDPEEHDSDFDLEPINDKDD